MIEEFIVVFLLKSDLLGILEYTCLSLTDGSYRNAVFLG